VQKYAGFSVAVELEYASFNKWRVVVFQLENITVAKVQKGPRFYTTNRHCNAKKCQFFYNPTFRNETLQCNTLSPLLKEEVKLLHSSPQFKDKIFSMEFSRISK